MSEKQKVIQQALKRLYQRIDMPTASDKIHFRAAMAAAGAKEEAPGAPERPAKPQREQEAAQAPEHPLKGATVAQVQALVESGEVTASEALDHEQSAEFPRKTLMAWLQEYEEDQDAR